MLKSALFAISLSSLLPWGGDKNADQPIQKLDEPHEVRDFAYGEFLYDYYQNRYFSSITKILVANERGQLKHHDEEAQLLLGALFISYGLLDEAETIFNRLIDVSVSKDTRNSAWFYLANLRYKLDQLDESEAILTQKLKDLSKAQEFERNVLLAVIDLQKGKFKDAIAKLESIPKKARLDIYAKYNLGVAFAGIERGENAVTLFDEVLTDSQNTLKELPKSERTELTAMKDRSALALGMNFLHLGDYDLAEAALKEIRLEGPYSNSALLTLGWARYSKKDPEGAFSPWFELIKRNPADPAVQEAYLQIPLVYEEMGALTDALQRYDQAFKVFNVQEAAIKKAQDRINQADWINQLSPVPDYKQDPLDVIPDFTPPASFETYYLYQFFASHRFNEGYRNYRELQRLKQLIISWQQTMPMYSDMVTSNRTKLAEMLPRVEKELNKAATQKAVTLKKLTQLTPRIKKALDDHDPVVTATQKEVARYDQIQEVADRINRHGDNKYFAKEREKIALMKGLWLWDQTEIQPEREWAIEKEQLKLVKQLEALDEKTRSIMQTKQKVSNRFEGFEVRIDDLDKRLSELLVRIDEALLKYQGQLQKTAIRILDQNLEHLTYLKGQAIFNTARLQDISYAMDRRRRGLIPDYDEVDPEEVKKQIQKEKAKEKEKKPWYQKYWYNDAESKSKEQE